MRALRSSLLFAVLALMLAPQSSLAGGVGISREGANPDSTVTAGSLTTTPFHLYKVPRIESPFANRDLEILWSDTYPSRYGTPIDSTVLRSEEDGLDAVTAPGGVTRTE